MTWLLTLACTGSPPVVPAPAPPSDTDTDLGPSCPTFGAGEAVGPVVESRVTEASGLAVVGERLWVHNDSGTPDLYALHPTGAPAGRVTLQTDPAVDWEGAAVRAGALWIGDVGDNLAQRTEVSLFEVQLPDPLTDGASVQPRAVAITWPDGPVDSETVLGDPVSDDLLLVTKVFDGDVGVYRVVDPDADASELEEVARLQFGEGLLAPTTLVTGGEIAPDGTAVALRTYLDAFVWPRTAGEPWAETFARDPCRIELETEPQGETLAWGLDALWTVSEGELPVLWRYPVLAP